MWRGPTKAGQVVELRFGFSLRGVEQAQDNLRTDCSTGPYRFDARRADTAAEWRTHLDTVSVDTSNEDRRTASPPPSTTRWSAVLRGEREPVLADGRTVRLRPVHDVDIYRTSSVDHRAVPRPCRGAGRTPCSTSARRRATCRSATGWPGRGPLLRPGQRAGADVPRRPVPARVSGIDWNWALCHIDTDLRRSYGEEYLLAASPAVTHALDLSFGYHCTAQVARHLGDSQLASSSTRWPPAGERLRLPDRPADRLDLLRGGRSNFSFRIQHDMQARIELAGATTGSWRCWTSSSATAPIRSAGRGAPERRGARRRLCAEPLRGSERRARHGGPLELPLLSRPDQTAEVVHAAVNNQFGLGRGGLPATTTPTASAPGTSGPASAFSPSPGRACT